MSTFVIKRGDTLPYITATLLEGVADVDLTGATVNFVMKRAATGCAPAIVLRKPVLVLNALTGSVRYEWAAGDTAAAGQYRGEFEISIGGRVVTHPTTGFIPITIVADLG